MTMFVSSWPMRFAMSTIFAVISSMAVVAAQSRPGSRRDRGATGVLVTSGFPIFPVLPAAEELAVGASVNRTFRGSTVNFLAFGARVSIRLGSM